MFGPRWMLTVCRRLLAYGLQKASCLRSAEGFLLTVCYIERETRKESGSAPQVSGGMHLGFLLPPTRGHPYICGQMRADAGICGHMRAYAGICGHMRAYAGICGYMRAYASRCGHMRADAGICGHMRAYAGICGYMRAYASRCGHMRAYAGICGHMWVYAGIYRERDKEGKRERATTVGRYAPGFPAAPYAGTPIPR